MLKRLDVMLKQRTQLGEQDIHDHMVRTISFFAFEFSDLDRVRASPFCIASVTHHSDPFAFEFSDLDRVRASPFCIASVTHHIDPFSVYQALVTYLIFCIS